MMLSNGLLEDLQAFCGAKIVGDTLGAEYQQLEGTDPVKYLGKLKSAKITKSKSVFRTGESQISDQVIERVGLLEEEMRENELMGEFERELLLERIGAL